MEGIRGTVEQPLGVVASYDPREPFRSKKYPLAFRTEFVFKRSESLQPHVSIPSNGNIWATQTVKQANQRKFKAKHPQELSNLIQAFLTHAPTKVIHFITPFACLQSPENPPRESLHIFLHYWSACPNCELVPFGKSTRKAKIAQSTLASLKGWQSAIVRVVKGKKLYTRNPLKWSHFKRKRIVMLE